MVWKGLIVPASFFILAWLFSRKSRKSRGKISIITPTIRRESETNFSLFQLTAEKLRRGENPPLPEKTSQEFRTLLTETVLPDQKSFLDATARSLERQTFRDFEWIIIDRLKGEREFDPRKHDFPIKHVGEKPSLWHGLAPPAGWESEAWPPFPTVNNARNTGILEASGELLIYADDTVLFPRHFLEVAWEWYEKGYGLKGYRDKFTLLEGKLILDREHEEFRESGEAYKRMSWAHSWGHILAIPLEWELEVNGWEEMLDGTIGAEDIDHGFRVQQIAPNKLILDRRAIVYELGGFHVQTGRAHVMSNALFLEYFFGVDCVRRGKRANEWRPSRDEMAKFLEWQKEQYHKGRIGELLAGKGDQAHPYSFKVCEAPVLELRKMKK